MKKYQLVLSLLAFIVIMFTLTGSVLSQTIKSNLNTNNHAFYRCPDDYLSTKPGSNIKTSVTQNANFKSMDIETISKTICIESFLDTLKEDVSCSYKDAKFNEYYEKYSKNPEIFFTDYNGFTYFLNTYKESVEENKRSEITKIEEYHSSFRDTVDVIPYTLVVFSHNEFCSENKNSVSCDKFAKLTNETVKLISDINKSLNDKCLEISNYFPRDFLSKIILIIGIPLDFDFQCDNFEHQLNEAIKSINILFENEKSTLSFNQSNISCSVGSIYQYNVVSTNLITPLAILLVSLAL